MVVLLIVNIMETKDITANNALLLEFMGVKPVYTWGNYKWNDNPFYSVSYAEESKTLNAMAEYAKYHKDFNWLIPVIERIQKLGFRVITEGLIGIKEMCSIESNDYYGRSFADSKIEAMYKAVVSFIQWFNSQNK